MAKTTVGEIIYKIELDSKDFVSNVKSAESKAHGSFHGIAKVAKVTFAAVATAVAAASAAVVGFAKSALDVGKEFDSDMSQVAATLGYTTEELHDSTSQASKDMQQLRDFAQEMGRTTVFSATESAEALNYMALAGYDAETSMGMLPKVLNLAAAGSIDLAAASDMVTDAQTALGLSLEQTGVMVDQMARAASKSNTSVEQLGEAILTVGGTAQYMAGGTQELNTVLGVLADNGIKGSEAGTHLRNMLLKLSSPTDEARALLKKLGVEVFDTEGNMRSFAEIFPELNKAMADFTDEQKLDAFSTLFNTRDIASATALLTTSKERWEELGGAILDSAGAAEQMAAVQLDNLEGDITLFKSALEGAKITLSDQLTPTMREFVKFGTDGIGRITEAFSSGGLEGAVDSFGEVLSEVIAKISEYIPSIIKVATKLVEALIKALIDNLPAILDGISEILNAVIEALPQLLTDIIPLIFEAIFSALLTLVDYLPEIVQALLDMTLSIVNSIIENLPTILKTIVEAIMGIVEVLTKPENLQAILRAGIQLLMALVEAIPEVIIALVNALPDIISNIIMFLIDPATIGMIIQAAIELFFGLVKAVPQILGALIKAFGDLIGNLWNGIKDMFAKFAGNFGEFITNIFKGAINGILGFIEGFINTPINILNGFIDIINGAFGWIGVNLGKIDTIKLPRLASGGIVPATPGGQIIMAGEAGEDEWVVPESKMASLIEQLERRNDEEESETVFNFTFNGVLGTPSELRELATIFHDKYEEVRKARML